MPLIWSPPPSPPDEIYQDSQVEQVFVITVSGDPLGIPPDAVTDLTWVLGPNWPPNTTITKSIVGGVGTLTITFHNFRGMFSESIVYQQTYNGPDITIQSFDDLPPDSTDVVAYYPDPVNNRITWIDVTATATSGPETMRYTFQVFKNYTTGRDQLVAAVDARRNNRPPINT